MRWQLLHTIDEIEPGRRIAGRATTDLPPALFADHFPSFPVTPGVLLVELGAQLGGFLVLATVWEERGHWVFPVLGAIREAKLRRFVPPRAEVAVEARLESLRPEAALLSARLLHDGRVCATMELLLAFDPAGAAAGGDPVALAAFCRRELERLGSPWLPAAPVAAAGGPAR